jgi:hypothetical protein
MKISSESCVQGKLFCGKMGIYLEKYGVIA